MHAVAPMRRTAVTVTAKGQVTIPKQVRNPVGIGPGTAGSVVPVPADKKRPKSCFHRLRGHAGEGLSTDAIMALTRGEP
ncbi:AbrB/SpoV domain-containing protein (plasmid) [Sinorhizobium fredii]|uniref:AbrB/SpoV domain-containing protein n=2 Tax=Rhizobium fredii TaxID=380 RepID=A0A2L0HGT5_RHIFR|nr:AbrB/SpoV domain-containing protein [Sinorhizobium fredii]